MPELPEVEVTRRGIMPSLTGGTVSGVVMRTQRLRYPLPSDLPRLLIGHTLRSIARRGKYLLLDFGTGTLLMHLGMSGSLRLLTSGAAPEKHDHLDLEFGQTLLRLRDPRRFGAVLFGTRASSFPPPALSSFCHLKRVERAAPYASFVASSPCFLQNINILSLSSACGVIISRKRSASS